MFELSGEHWRVSRRVPVAAAGGRRGAELTAVALREGVCPEPGLLVSSSEPGRAVPGGAAGSTWIRPRLDPGCTAFKTLGAAVFLQTFKINGCPHPSFLKKLMEPFTRLTPRSGWCLCRPVTGCGAAAEFPQTASWVSRGPEVRPRCHPFLSPSAHRCSPLPQPAASLGEACPGLPVTCRLQVGVAPGRHRRANSGCRPFQCDKVLRDLPSISVEPGVSALLTQLFICLSCSRTPPSMPWAAVGSGGASVVRPGPGAALGARGGCTGPCAWLNALLSLS